MLPLAPHTTAAPEGGQDAFRHERLARLDPRNRIGPRATLRSICHWFVLCLELSFVDVAFAPFAPVEPVASASVFESCLKPDSTLLSTDIATLLSADIAAGGAGGTRFGGSKSKRGWPVAS